MTVEPDSRTDALTGLATTLATWTSKAKAGPLERWLAKELDAQGAPVRLPIAEWSPALTMLVAAREARGGWSSAVDERVLDFFRTLLRFTRPDGRTATLDSLAIPAGEVRDRLERVADVFPESDAARVLGWWYPDREVEPIPPPLPAWSSPDRVLGVLRADWTSRGDFLTFDQRDGGSSTHFELFGSGRAWLGDSWHAPGGVEGEAALVKPASWKTSSGADVAEWTFQANGLSITRVLVLLRGRRVAILADQVDGVTPATSLETTVMIPASSLTVTPIPDSRALLLKPAAAGKSAQVIPMGLPSLPYETERGRFGFDEAVGGLVLSQSATSAPSWLPLLISWDHARHRKRLTWRALTVSESSKACSPETAWAARVSWGRSETFVVYRSFGPPARRSFLGGSTTARFFVGRFTPEGDIDPIVTLA